MRLRPEELEVAPHPALASAALPSSGCSTIELLASPSALRSTMRALVRSDARNERLGANDVSRERSSSVIAKSAFGLPLVIALSDPKDAATVRPIHARD